MPCMCGKWFWQGLKLMISTCAIVENHQKEKVQTKALAVQPRRGHRWRNHKDCETEAVERTSVKKRERERKKEHVLLIQNVNSNAKKKRKKSRALFLLKI